MHRPHISSLGARLLLLLLLAVLPAVSFMGWTAWREYEREREALAGRALERVRLAAVEHAHDALAARQLLAGLALSPVALAGDSASRAALFERLCREDGALQGLGLAAPDGRVLAAAGPAAGAEDVSAAPWFRAALAGGATLGEAREPLRVGGAPTRTAALGLRGADARPAGVLFAVRALGWPARLADVVSPLPGGAFAVIHGDGTLLLRHPRPEAAVGAAFGDPALVRRLRVERDGVARLRGPDGVGRVFAFATLPSASGEASYLVAGYAEGPALAAARADLLRALLALLALTLALLLAAWIGARGLVLEPMDRLLQATRRLGRGDLTARAGPWPHRDEFGQLAAAFDDMTGRLAARMEERRRAEEALRDSEARKSAIVEAAQDALILADPRGNILEFNATAERLFGYRREDVAGADVVELLAAPDQREACRAGLERYARGGTSPLVGRVLEARVRRADGGEFPAEVAFTPIRQSAGGLLFSVSVSDATDRREHEQALRALSLVDELTGLYNRRGLLTLGVQQLYEADRAMRRATLLFADLDHLKVINDTWGHAEGDAAIVAAAGLLRETFRRSDIVARIGGDEFAVLAPEASPAGVARLELRLREKAEAFNAQSGQPWRLSLSLGRARYDPARPCSIEELLARADESMYEQKRTRHEAEPA